MRRCGARLAVVTAVASLLVLGGCSGITGRLLRQKLRYLAAIDGIGWPSVRAQEHVVQTSGFILLG